MIVRPIQGAMVGGTMGAIGGLHGIVYGALGGIAVGITLGVMGPTVSKAIIDATDSGSRSVMHYFLGVPKEPTRDPAKV